MTDPSTTAGREIVITRVFDAPRERVFRAWTDPAGIGQWWGPKGFTTTTLEINVKPGGVWRFIMHGPDGTDYPNAIVYKEIVRGERLVFDHGSGDDSQAGTFEATVTFADEGGKTRLTMRSLFPTVEARTQAADEFKAIEGGNETLDRLAAYLAKG